MNVIAVIDLDQVSQFDESNTGVDFIHEIDIWARMEAQSRQQIHRLKYKKFLKNNRTPKSLDSLYYSFRNE